MGVHEGLVQVGGPATTGGTTLRERLRSLPVFAGQLPQFDPEAAPDDPVDLFTDWLTHSIDAGVAEPHAMTLATASDAGTPSARVVILKDCRDGGWEFATDARSRKARELAANPRAAATFYWQPQARQVRLTGPVLARGPRADAEDFLARSPASRAAALAVRPGEPLESTAALGAAMAAAQGQVEREPGLVLEDWRLFALVPLEVEFFQGDPRRAHVRVVYRRDDVGCPWRHELVWP